MHLLAIDTATNSGGVAISRNSEITGVVMIKTPLRYSDRLIGYVDFLLKELNLTIGHFDCFVVSTGPGSFTGLRIGLACVKAWCQSQQKPCVGVSTLEALAHRFRTQASRIAPLIDARRQQVYGAVYDCSGKTPQVVQPARVAPPAAWLKELDSSPELFVGDGAQLYGTTIQALRPESQILKTDNYLLTGLCQIGFQRYCQGQTLTAAELKAVYIRPTDAELSQGP
jgi:tRNA threonylcarbamoyladenosine biosynthesis protein TsaB